MKKKTENKILFANNVETLYAYILISWNHSDFSLDSLFVCGLLCSKDSVDVRLELLISGIFLWKPNQTNLG